MSAPRIHLLDFSSITNSIGFLEDQARDIVQWCNSCLASIRPWVWVPVPSPKIIMLLEYIITWLRTVHLLWLDWFHYKLKDDFWRTKFIYSSVSVLFKRILPELSDSKLVYVHFIGWRSTQVNFRVYLWVCLSGSWRCDMGTVFGTLHHLWHCSHAVLHHCPELSIITPLCLSVVICLLHS